MCISLRISLCISLCYLLCFFTCHTSQSSFMWHVRTHLHIHQPITTYQIIIISKSPIVCHSCAGPWIRTRRRVVPTRAIACDRAAIAILAIIIATIGFDDEHVRLQAHQQAVLLVHPPLVLVRLPSRKCDVAMREGPAGGREKERVGEYAVAMYKRGHQRCRDESIRGAAVAATWRAWPIR